MVSGEHLPDKPELALVPRASMHVSCTGWDHWNNLPSDLSQSFPDFDCRNCKKHFFPALDCRNLMNSSDRASASSFWLSSFPGQSEDFEALEGGISTSKERDDLLFLLVLLSPLSQLLGSDNCRDKGDRPSGLTNSVDPSSVFALFEVAGSLLKSFRLSWDMNIPESWEP